MSDIYVKDVDLAESVSAAVEKLAREMARYEFTGFENSFDWSADTTRETKNRYRRRAEYYLRFIEREISATHEHASTSEETIG